MHSPVSSDGSGQPAGALPAASQVIGHRGDSAGVPLRRLQHGLGESSAGNQQEEALPTVPAKASNDGIEQLMSDSDPLRTFRFSNIIDG
jgi:hypothetical protein